ncbi:hypothetical protein DSM106972_078270 [Dulcicalothrix desertica PCC 7102]|uniref:Uncharacterized protein n=1 Tax=Dulcicalothrix desertica PCC 7102 TaxID=232991 RepID=A0A3S1C9J1_9CYAN|nr:hypothetical protein [Dulcicalothrix desertica]RUS99385.1 hypothetical protein DSM106972_078270 [Dulcicalothrix desertica PCC 7102]TWH50045.1 hypothetical protein CAL7102_04325 [Dulcicalothrix desertica PCC 7102]
MNLLKNTGVALGLSLITGTSQVTESTFAIPTKPQQTAQSTSKIKSNAVFAPILPKLKKNSKIAILLPKQIPGSESENKLYAVVETATPNKYGIILGFTPDCNGGTACRYGFVGAESVTNKTPRQRGKVVSLQNRTTAYFTESQCGANCSDGILTWRRRGVQYSAGLKAGKLNDVLQMANSFVAP